MRKGKNLLDLREGCHCIRAYMYIFKGKEDTFEIRVQKAKEKFAGNEMVMEQIAFIEESLKGRRNILTAE